MTVTDITTALETRVETVTSFSKLPYVYDIEKNNWNMVQDAYGVRPSQVNETESVTKRLTYIQNFDIVLTKGYVQSSVDDTSLQSAVNELMDLAHSVFVDIEQSRAGIPNVVLNVTELTIDEPTVFDDEKVVALTATVNVLYRLSV